MDYEESKLNDDWINNFEKSDKLYQDFYKDDLYYVNLKYIYINTNNEIEKIKQEVFLMSTPNKITREENLKILKKSLVVNNIKYSLFSILRYNINLDTFDVKNFLSHHQIEDNSYLSVIKNIDAISFDTTINMFQDLNEIIFLFHEKSIEAKDNKNNITKKIYITENKKTNTHKKHNRTIKKKI